MNISEKNEYTRTCIFYGKVFSYSKSERKGVIHCIHGEFSFSTDTYHSFKKKEKNILVTKRKCSRLPQMSDAVVYVLQKQEDGDGYEIKAWQYVEEKEF